MSTNSERFSIILLAISILKIRKENSKGNFLNYQFLISTLKILKEKEKENIQVLRRFRWKIYIE